MQGGGGETGDGVSARLAEETHGAERVSAEERGGGAKGELALGHINREGLSCIYKKKRMQSLQII